MREKPTTYQAIHDHGVRTYGDLIRVARPTSERGTCCACHRWDAPTWQLSTRASICAECCERKRDEVLGSIKRAEHKARTWVAKHPDAGAKFIAHVSGASLAFVENLYSDAALLLADGSEHD